jgi:hypothetical protein
MHVYHLNQSDWILEKCILSADYKRRALASGGYLVIARHVKVRKEIEESFSGVEQSGGAGDPVQERMYTSQNADIHLAALKHERDQSVGRQRSS